MSPTVLRNIAAVMCLTMLGLLTFGIVMLASTSTPLSHLGDAFYFTKRQGLWLACGLIACAITANVDYHNYRKLALGFFILETVLLLAVLVLGRRINGASRWLSYGPIRFQPSEFAKYATIVVLAFWLEKAQRARKGQLRPMMDRWSCGLAVPIGIALVPAVLVLREPDLGTVLLVLAVTLVLMWIAGVSSRWLGTLVGSGAAGGTAMLVAIFRFGMFPQYYQVQRLLHWWHEDDLLGSNFQQFIAMLAFGSGGIWGLGLGNSRMKLAYLPEAHTDFIFPIIGEELGLAATLAVLAAFSLLVVCGLVLAAHAPDSFGLLVGVGVVSMVGLQAAMNIAVVTNTIPNKGVPLPFISYGGSNIVMELSAFGVLLNIGRHARAHTLKNFTANALCTKPTELVIDT